jgi:hypothetical protein
VATVDHPSTSSLQATDGTFSGAVSATSLDADGGITVDNITIDGTEIDLSSGDLTIDVEGKIALDANDDGSIKLQDNGTEYARIDGNSSNLRIISQISDKDIIFNGNDGGSAITALTLDMSEGGIATFSSHIELADNKELRVGNSHDLKILHDGSNSYIKDEGTGSLIIRSNRHRIQSDGGENVIEAHADGAVELYYDTSKKLETTTTGINITGAINIGGTGTANALDDYEEGTWTPTSATSGSFTVTSNSANYTKVGRLVTAYCRVSSFSDTTSSNAHFYVGGLPFTVSTENQEANIGNAWGQFLGTNRTIFFYSGSGNTTTAGAYYSTAGSGYGTVYHSGFSGSTNILIKLQYFST